MKRLGLIALIATAIGLYIGFDLGRFFAIEEIEALVQQDRGLAIAMYFGFYLTVCMLNLPGTGPLSIASGMIFGFATGLLVVSFAGAIGATISMVLARTLFRDWVRRRFSRFSEKVNQGLEESAAVYLFTVRMIPIIPFFIVNPVFGLTRMPVWVFYLVSQLGMLPVMVLYVNVGTSIASLDALSFSAIFTPQIIVSFALIITLPYALKVLLAKFKTWQGIRGESPS